jgi:hypothetical protein
MLSRNKVKMFCLWSQFIDYHSLQTKYCSNLQMSFVTCGEGINDTIHCNILKQTQFKLSAEKKASWLHIAFQLTFQEKFCY